MKRATHSLRRNALSHFKQGWPLPTIETPYTLVTFPTTTFEVADLTFDFAEPLTNLIGSFSLESNALKFTIMNVSSDRVFGDGFE